MEDRDLAAALVAGRPGTPLGSQALAALYDAYADRLFAYAVSVLRDRDLAADALHDALLVAHDRAEQLRDPGRLRAWLFAITRNECLRILRARSRYADQEEATDMPDTTVDLDAGLAREEAAALVSAGMGALSATDRDVLSLALRHDLDPSEVSAALGVSANQAHARLSRARASLERAIGAVLLARTRGRDCPELAAILAAASADGSDTSTHDEGTSAGAAAGLGAGPSASAGADASAAARARADASAPASAGAGASPATDAGAGASARSSAGAVVMTPLLRKRVARHAESCEVCERDRRRGIAALAPAFAVPAALTAPADLRTRLLDPVLGEGDPHAREPRNPGTHDTATTAAQLAERARPFRRDGFPVPLDRSRRPAAAWLLAGAAALLVVLGVGYAVLPDSAPVAAPTSAPTSATATSAPSPSASTSPSESASPGGAIGAPGSPAAGASASSAPPVVAPTPTPAPTASASPAPTRTSTPSAPPAPPSPPFVGSATAADLAWTAADGFTDCASLAIRVRSSVSGSVTAVRARLERVGGATTTITLTRSGDTWSATAAGLPAPSEWVVTVVATGPGGTAERVAEVTAPTGGGTTLTHICPL